MSKGRKKRNPAAVFFGALVKTILVCTIMIAAVFVGYRFVKKQAVSTVSKKVVQSVAKEAADASGGAVTEEQINAALDSMEEEDRQALEEIVEEHMDSDMVQKAVESAKNGDYQSLMEYAQQELDDEETAKLLELYNKYQGEFQ